MFTPQLKTGSNWMAPYHPSRWPKPRGWHKIFSQIGPMTPLRLNPDFAPGSHTSFLKEIWPHSNVRAGNFFEGGLPLSYTNLAARLTMGTLPFWTYVQIRQFLDTPARSSEWSRQHTLFRRNVPQNGTPKTSHIIHVCPTILRSEPQT